MFRFNAFAPLKWHVVLRNEYAQAIKVARGTHSGKDTYIRRIKATLGSLSIHSRNSMRGF